jgi:hypothetical protein
MLFLFFKLHFFIYIYIVGFCHLFGLSQSADYVIILFLFYFFNLKHMNWSDGCLEKYFKKDPIERFNQESTGFSVDFFFGKAFYRFLYSLLFIYVSSGSIMVEPIELWFGHLTASFCGPRFLMYWLIWVYNTFQISCL